ncbi:ferric reductase-like transmembrane domain-containing protein [Hankyongella ginsenosidimutans]|uniref:ferric reductase-like transmembrane domain-containing protein n=1 Tax=Hankyongella ginsenosidimutans TaxID=1763828 RepID=UPI003CCC5049
MPGAAWASACCWRCRRCGPAGSGRCFWAVAGRAGWAPIRSRPPSTGPACGPCASSSLRWRCRRSPLKPLAWLRGHRRLFGLAAFGYATAHLLLYVGLDQGWALPAILRELIKRWYLTLGISAWLILVPLAVTSTRGWMIRLKKQWRILHWGSTRRPRWR